MNTLKSKITAIHLLNKTDRPNREILSYIKFVCPDSLPEDVYVDVINELEDYPWDGTAYPDNRVEVLLNEKLTDFPMEWWPNEEFKEIYVRGMILKSPEEFFIYTLAHELRHIWQWHNPRRKRLGAEFDGDNETDSDLYAIIKLNQWRLRNKK